jgi:acetyl-CoA C-acetyltransferase
MAANTAVILSACRTAIGSFGGALKDIAVPDLGAVVIREAIARAGVPAAAVDDVLMGCVLQAGAGMNVARQAAVKAGLPDAVPAMTINRVCGSGLQAVASAAQAIRAGDATIVVAGGMESMSNAVYLLKQARWGLRMGHGELVDSMIADGLTCAIGACHMGVTAEEIATRYGIDRAAQDAFAAESQRRAVAAIDAGEFVSEIVPVSIPQRKGEALSFARDEYPRPGSTAEALATLRPAFNRTGSVTAGNASGINDGAAALVVAEEQRAHALRLRPIARIVASAVTGIEPMVMGLGPVAAVRKTLERAGWLAADVDLYELNEAFAVQSLAVMRDLGLSAERVNVCGGAVALGHPIGASGARVLVTLLHALERQGGQRGIASLCIGGGMGIAMAVERM